MDFNDFIAILEMLVPVVISIGVAILISFGFTKLMKKHPKSYVWINLPVILYPYGYIIAMVLTMLIGDGKDLFYTLLALFLIIHPWVLGAIIADFRVCKTGAIKANKLATIVMVIKLVHIPAFVFHFVMGLFGSLASIWGIGFVLFAVTIDLITIVISGTFSLAGIIGMRKQNNISTAIAILAGILCYIYCVDVVAVIVLKIISSAKYKTQKVLDS